MACTQSFFIKMLCCIFYLYVIQMRFQERFHHNVLLFIMWAFSTPYFQTASGKSKNSGLIRVKSSKTCMAVTLLSKHGNFALISKLETSFKRTLCSIKHSKNIAVKKNAKMCNNKRKTFCSKAYCTSPR